ncbi:MAG: hypothetical protein QG608_3844 [Actinomycetota bacterium]|nr:hypothetical protein [Actinomycetota bacterium]
MIWSGRPDRIARVPQALLASCLLLPTMFLAHLATTGTIPPARLALPAAAVVLGVLLLHRSGSRIPVLCAGLGQLLGQAVLALPVEGSAPGSHGCLPVVGRGAELGLRLALFRQSQECPSQTLAQGPTSTAVTASLLGAVAILLAHTLAAVWGSAVAAWLTSCVVLAASLLRRLGSLGRPLPTLVPATRPRPCPASWPPRAFPVPVLGPTGRRGPPLLPVL